MFRNFNMTEIHRPKLQKVILLAHTQGDAYDLAFEQHLASPVQERLMANGQLYLHRLRTTRPLPENAHYLHEMYARVEDESLKALALRLHLAGDTANMSRLVVACADADPAIELLQADEPELLSFRDHPDTDIRLLETGIAVNISRSPYSLARELITFSHQMGRANSNNTF